MPIKAGAPYHASDKTLHSTYRKPDNCLLDKIVIVREN